MTTVILLGPLTLTLKTLVPKGESPTDSKTKDAKTMKLCTVIVCYIPTKRQQ